jgi:hypothetical protein
MRCGITIDPALGVLTIGTLIDKSLSKCRTRAYRRLIFSFTHTPSSARLWILETETFVGDGCLHIKSIEARVDWEVMSSRIYS